MGTGNTPELAQKNGVARTIPNKIQTESVTATEGSVDLSAYGGQWIFLKSAGADITVLRADSTPTLVSGVGWVISSTPQEHYVDPAGSMLLFHIAGGSVSMHILSDTEQR